MIPSDFKAVAAEKKYDLIPKDVYEAQVMSLKLDKKPTYETRSLPAEAQQFQTVLTFEFALLEPEELKSRRQWVDVPNPNEMYASKKGKCRLWQILEAYKGKELTLDDAVSLATPETLNEMVGKQIRISIDSKASDSGKVYNYITGYMKSKTELDKIALKQNVTLDEQPYPEETTEVIETINVEDIPF